ncbi:MAG TPA: DUF5320 domain-containing protein [Firmicutes bacterium]|nr:DUF5320 domain-containing protein [Bacillota bacterium]
MPRGDGTGPMRYGPMTGRGLGYCAGYPAPGYMHAGYGFGRGFGYGRGLGWGRVCGRGMGIGFRRGFRTPVAPGVPGYPHIDEEEALKEEAAYLEKSLEAVRKRLLELKDKKDKEA